MEQRVKGKRGGKTPFPYPDNWIAVYNDWLKGNLSAKQSSIKLNIGYGTFYNMAERYEIENGIIRERKKTARRDKYRGLNRVLAINGLYAYEARKYNDYIERNVLPRIDYIKLFDSYHTEDMEYAKGIFNLLHQAMIKIYGSEIISDGSSSELILIPGVAFGNGEICLALLVIDLAGRIREADFLTEYGCCTEHEDMLPEEKQRLKEVARRYTPYVCGYSVDLPRDKFNINELPEKVQNLLENFRDYEARLLCEWSINRSQSKK